MKYFKFLISVMLVLGLFCCPEQGFAANIGEQEVIIKLNETFASRHIWRGLDCFPDNDPIIHSNIDLAFPKLIEEIDFCFHVWNGSPLKDGHVISQENDYSTTIGRNFFERFNLSAGHIYYDKPRANQHSDFNDLWCSLTWLELPWLPIPVSATIFAAYEFEAAAEGPENGWYYSWSLDTSLPLPDWAFLQKDQKIGINLTNWGNDGPGGLKSSELYATDLSISTGYALGGFTVTPGFHYVINHEEEINSGNEELWGSIDISYSF